MAGSNHQVVEDGSFANERYLFVYIHIMILCYCNKMIQFNFLRCLLVMEQELAGHLNAPVVFAHNDLLSGNIMVNDEKGKMSS